MDSWPAMALRPVRSSPSRYPETIILTFVLDNELVDAQQNLYNVGYDLANLLAIAGVGLVSLYHRLR